MKKYVLVLLSIVMVLGFVACKANNNKTDDEDKKDASISVTPAEIERKIADAIGKDNDLCDIDVQEDYLQNNFDLDLSKIESYVAKQNSISSVHPDTVIILKVKDGYADTAVNALNTSFAQMVNYIRQYPFGTAKVLNGRIYQCGNYVMYILAGACYDGEDSEAENKLAVSEYAKIDGVIESILGTLPENSAAVPENHGSTGGLLGGN